MMGPALVAGVTAVYCVVALERALAADWPRAAIFAGYTLANVGLLFTMR